MNALTRDEKRKIFDQVGEYVSRRLESMKERGIYYVDITRETGLAANRISEIVNNRQITPTGFKALLEGGFVTVKDVIENTNLTEREETFLNGFRVHENKNAYAKAIVRCQDDDLDGLEALLNLIQLGKEGEELLRKAVAAKREAEK